MPRRKGVAPPATGSELYVPRELLDHRISGSMTQGYLTAMFGSLNETVIERTFNATMTEHLSYGHGGGQSGTGSATTAMA